MKKKKLIAMILCAMLAAGTVVPLTACGSTPEPSTPAVTENSIDGISALTKDSASDVTVNVDDFPGTHLQKLLDTYPQINDELRDGFASTGADQASVISDLYVKNDMLQFDVTFQQQFDKDAVFAMQDSLTYAASGMKQGIQTVLKNIGQETAVENPRLVINYCNADGSIIKALKFDAKGSMHLLNGKRFTDYGALIEVLLNKRSDIEQNIRDTMGTVCFADGEFQQLSIDQNQLELDYFLRDVPSKNDVRNMVVKTQEKLKLLDALLQPDLKWIQTMAGMPVHAEDPVSLSCTFLSPDKNGGYIPCYNVVFYATDDATIIDHLELF